MPKANAHGRVQRAGLAKAGSVVVIAALTVVLGWGLWMSRKAPPIPDAAVEAAAPAENVGTAAAEAEMDRWSYERLGSQDPQLVAAAAVELRDEWFYADNDVLMASVEQVFVTAVSPAAMFMLNGLTLQRASLWDAPEANKTYYHTAALSTTVLGETEGDVLVEVWAVEVISRRNLIEPMSQWTRERLLMRYDAALQRWKVAEWSSVEGPVPTLTPQLGPSTATELEFDLDGHARVRDWLGVAADEELGQAS